MTRVKETGIRLYVYKIEGVGSFRDRVVLDTYIKAVFIIITICSCTCKEKGKRETYWWNVLSKMYKIKLGYIQIEVDIKCFRQLELISKCDYTPSINGNFTLRKWMERMWN